MEEVKSENEQSSSTPDNASPAKPAGGKGKTIIFVVIGFILLIILICCAVFGFLAWQAANDTEGVDEKKTDIENRYSRLSKVYDLTSQIDSESFTAATCSNNELEDALSQDQMIYAHFEFLKDFPGNLESDDNNEEWRFMVSEDLLDLPELDSITTNPTADNALDTLKAVDDGMKIVVFQDDFKTEPRFETEESDLYAPGQYVGYILVFEMSDEPEYICEEPFEFENLVDPAYSQVQLEQDLEDQFMKMLDRLK